jgi:tetratricopeptide (TPR) repeat protein
MVTLLSLARVNALLERHRVDQAIDEVRQLLEAEPENASLHTALAVCLLRQQRVGQAEQAALLALALNPESAHSWYLLGLIELGRNRPTAAQAFLNEALSRNPSRAQYLGALGWTYAMRQEWDQALRCAREGLESNPDDAACLELQASASMQVDAHTLGMQAVAQMLSANPDGAAAQHQAGQLMLEQGNYAAAGKHLTEALRLEPTSEAIRKDLLQAKLSRFPWCRAGWALMRVMRRPLQSYVQGLDPEGARVLTASTALLLMLPVAAILLQWLLRVLGVQELGLWPFLTSILAVGVLAWVLKMLTLTLARFDSEMLHLLTNVHIRNSDLFVGGAAAVGITCGVFLIASTWLSALPLIGLGLGVLWVGHQRLPKAAKQGSFLFLLLAFVISLVALAQLRLTPTHSKAWLLYFAVAVWAYLPFYDHQQSNRGTAS